MRRLLPCLLTTLALAAVAHAAPVVWQVQDPVKPGETVMLFGDGLGAAQVQAGRIPDGPAGEPGRPLPGAIDLRPVPVLQGTDRCLKFPLPAPAQPGLFGYRLQTATGQAQGLLNRPVVWWAQLEPPTPGSAGMVLRLFGKNLTGPQAQVYVKGPRTARLPLGKQNDMWAARVALPASLPLGSYQVYFHSGYGGPQGWSASLPLTLGVDKPWPAQVYNVKDFGADGAGTRDDTGAIQAALDKAGAAGGGVVFVPRGRYQVSAGLTIPRFTVLRGEATDLTALFWPDMATPPEALVQGTNSFAVESLTIYASNARHVIAGDLGDKPDAGHVRLWRVRSRVNAYRGHIPAEDVDKRHRDLARIFGGDSVRLGGDDLVISECDLYGNGRALFLSRTRNGVVRHNNLYNGRHGWYCISGSDGLIFEDNRIQGADLMATGGGLNCLDGSSYSQNVYYARNRLTLMHGWDREAMTSDAGGGLYYGPIAKAEGTVLALPETPKVGGKNWVGAAVFVFDGKGWTQVRRVVKVEGDQVTIDRPWDVPPDSTSLVGVTMMQRHYIIAGNQFSDAGIAVQFYGTSLEHIVAGNSCARAGGFQGIGKPYGGYNFPPDKNPCHQPSWFCQFLGNTITEGSIYRSGANNSILSGDSVIGVFGWPLTRDWKWPYNVGSAVRANYLQNNARLHVGGSGNDNASVSDVLVENNIIANADQGLRLDRAVRDVLVRGNEFRNLREPLGGDGLDRATFGPEQLVAAEITRLRGVAAECGAKDDAARWPAVERALAGLRNATAWTPEARQASAAATAALLAGLSERQLALPSTTATALLGLDVQVSRASTLPALLQKGGGGPATLNLDVTLARPLPSCQVAAEITVPPGWLASPGDPVALTDGKATLALKLQTPPTAWSRVTLPLKLELKLPQATVPVTRSLVVGTGQIRDWMVAGPFANKSGQPLDLTLYPPEDALDLTATYAGGQKWQPVQLGNEWLDFGSVLKTKGPGVAYAVACVNVPTDTPAVLRLGSSGGVAVSLSGGYLWAGGAARGAAPDQDRVPLTLKAGDNVLLVKVSTSTEQWRFTAELTPVDNAFAGAVTVIPAAQFPGRAALAPPKPRPAPQTGEVRFGAGVNWQLVYADDFATDGLAARWRQAVGKWTATGGVLQSGGDQCFLAYAEKLAAPVRIEYDTRILGNTGGDLSAFWLNDPTNYGAGHLFGFGSNGNTCNKLLIEGTEVITAPRPLVVPGKWHHVIAQVLADGRAQLIVDEQLALDFKGPAPGQPRHPGLWTWGAAGAFSKVRVYQGAK